MKTCPWCYYTIIPDPEPDTNTYLMTTYFLAINFFQQKKVVKVWRVRSQLSIFAAEIFAKIILLADWLNPGPSRHLSLIRIYWETSLKCFKQ